MYDTIGNATYLKKGSGDYVPFRLRIEDTNCNKIIKMLDR